MAAPRKNKEIGRLKLTEAGTPEEAHALGCEISTAAVLPLMVHATLGLDEECRAHVWRGLLSGLLGAMESDCGHPRVREYLKQMARMTQQPIQPPAVH